MRLLPVVILTSFLSYSASGQTYTISTFAGGALPANIQATTASLGAVGGLAVDGSGNILIANGQYGRVLRLDPVTGLLTLVAGNGTHGFSGDNGAATSAQLTFPSAVAVDSAGNIYIADGSNNRIRKIANGVITTIAGNGTQGYSGDNGPASGAQLYFPTALAVDSTGALYIADTDNNVVRKIANGVITTVAGGGSQVGDNGPPTSAQLKSPGGLAFDAAGNLYIAEGGGNRVRKVSNNIIVTVAGNGTAGFSGDSGPATSAQLNNPEGIAVDSASNLYIADVLNNRVRKVSLANGTITSIAGSGVQGFGGDSGTPAGAQLNFPSYVTLDSGGNLYVTDSGNHRIRKIANGTIVTVAGGGTQLGDNGPPTNAQLAQPTDVVADSTGNVYITDSGNASIRKVSNGVITTAAGNEVPGFSGDNGQATSAQLFLGNRSGLAVDANGALYISDSNNHRVRKVVNGVITTVAGTGTAGFSGDGGPATSAQLNAPAGVAVDGAGNLYIADSLNQRIRKVANGTISTVAGNGTSGFSGDNGVPTSAMLATPLAVAADSSGNVYIGDSGNYRVRKVSGGTITTVAGTGVQGYSGDGGPATSAQLGAFPAVSVDSTGNLYIADFGNVRIRKISGGVINTIAGTGVSGFSGDGGPGTSGQFASPAGIAVDSAGRVYVADQGNNRVRLVAPAVSCSYVVSPLTLQAPAGGGNLTVNIQTSAACPWTVTGLPAWLSASGASSGTGSGSVTLVAAANSGAALTATITIAGAAVTVSQAAAGAANGPVITAVANGASFLSGIAANAYITIAGSNLSTVTNDWSNSIVDGNLPTSLDGVSVSIGGKPAYLEFVSPGQINAIAPDIGAGSMAVTVTNALGTSAAFTVASQVFGPAFFPWPGGYVVATRQDFSLAVKNGTFPGTTTIAAKPGDVIILWGTGFGPTSPPAPVGATVPSTGAFFTANTVTVTIGGVPAMVYGAALASQYASTFQVAIQIPTTLANGDYPVVATVGNIQSPVTAYTGTISVQQ